MKKEYRRRKQTSDTWHWCTNCPNWPQSNFETWCGDGRPSQGELCNTCRALEARRECKSKAC